MNENIYTVEQIAPNSYRLDEHGFANCYLLVGSERAMLIDTGLGLGRLKDEVEKLTSLPLDVVLTHAHCDHAGGTGWFPQYYVHIADRPLVYRFLSSRFAAHLMKPKGMQLQKLPHRSAPVFIKDGHVFDLGGRKVRAVNVPGHTRGSIALVDEGEKLLFTGDDCNESLWMQLPGCTTLKSWLQGGQTLLDLAKTYRPWCGHGMGRQSLEQMERTYQLVNDLSQGKNASFGKIGFYPSKDVIPQIVYNTKKRN